MTEKIYVGDCRTMTNQTCSDPIKLAIVDPPYATGTQQAKRKKYGNNSDQMSDIGYHDFTFDWVSAVNQVLAVNGSIFVMTSGSRAPIINAMLSRFEFKCQNWISWHYTQGRGSTVRFSIRHDTILWFTKGPKHTFNLDAVRVPQKFYRKVNNMRGANPGDVWEFPRVAAHVASRQEHPSQKPEGLIERMVLAASNPGDTVLDPFAGSGTTARVCQQLGRNSVSIELNDLYVVRMYARLKQPFTGFDSTDPRMFRIPNEIPDSPVRDKYYADHKRWFLSGRSESDLLQFDKDWQAKYPN